MHIVVTCVYDKYTQRSTVVKTRLRGGIIFQFNETEDSVIRPLGFEFLFT